MKRGLSGYIPIRDMLRLDYCADEVIVSMLPVCDELILCDSDSTDGTTEHLHEWARRDNRIRVINWPWPDPVGKSRMLVDWLNFAREHCEYDVQITSDADEVLCPGGYEAIREAVAEGGARWFQRLSFWKDTRHVVPDGHVCGSFVARLGPTELMMVSDEPRPEGDPEIRLCAEFDTRLRFFHYGFLRRQEAFFAKSKVVQRALHNTYDDRLRDAEAAGEDWTIGSTPFELVEYAHNDHPECAREWLRERGNDV